MVMALNALSRLTGFIKLLLLARAFGVGSAADAYAAANQLPELFSAMLAGGAVAAAFIPVYAAQLATGDKARAARLANTMVTLTVLVMGALTGSILLYAGPLTAVLLTPNFPPAQQAQTAHLVQIIMGATFIFAVGSIYASILQTHNHFFAPALGSVLIDLGQIAAILLLSAQIGIASAAWGLVVGALLVVVVQAPFLWRLGLHSRPALALRTEGMAELARLFWPRLVTMGAGQAVDLIVVQMASGLAPGSMSAYFYAVLIMAMMPRGLFAGSVTTVIFPTLARQYNAGNILALRVTTTGGLRAVLMLTIPAAAGILALGLPGMHFLFPSEGPSSTTLSMVFALTAILAVRLLADSTNDILALAFYARHNTRLPMFASLAWMGLTFVLSRVLVEPLGIYGLAWASSLASLALSAGLFACVQRLNGLELRELAMTVGRALIAAGAMVLAVRLLATMGLPTTLFVVASIAVGTAIYAAVSVALGGSEILGLLRHMSAKSGV